MLTLLFLTLVSFARADAIFSCADSKNSLAVDINSLSTGGAEAVFTRSTRTDVIRGYALSVGSNLVYKSPISIGFDGPKEDDGVFEDFRVTIQNARNISQGHTSSATVVLRQYEYAKKFFCDKVDVPPIPRDENDPVVIRHKCKRWDLVRQPLKTITTDLVCKLLGENQYKDYCLGKSQQELQELLFLGSRTQTPDVAEQAIACGADVNATDYNECSPLMMSVATKKMSCSTDEDLPQDSYRMPKSRFLYNMLASNGAYLDLQDSTGESAVHKAIRGDNRPALKDMISLESDLNLQDTSGSTPIMLAADLGLSNIIRTLVAAEADLTLKDNDGRTAYDRGEKLSEEIRNLLVGAKVTLTIEGQTDGKCSPLQLQATKGESTKVVLKSSPDKMFMLTIPKADISLMADSGKTAAKTIQFKQSGNFDFECGVHGGTQSKGVIVVK